MSRGEFDSTIEARPLPVVELVSVVIRGHDVQQQDVLGLRVQSGNPELHLREHLPGTDTLRLDWEHLIIEMTKLELLSWKKIGCFSLSAKIHRLILASCRSRICSSKNRAILFLSYPIPIPYPCAERPIGVHHPYQTPPYTHRYVMLTLTYQNYIISFTILFFSIYFQFLSKGSVLKKHWKHLILEIFEEGETRFALEQE